VRTYVLLGVVVRDRTGFAGLLLITMVEVEVLSIYVFNAANVCRMWVLDRLVHVRL